MDGSLRVGAEHPNGGEKSLFCPTPSMINHIASNNRLWASLGAFPERRRVPKSLFTSFVTALVKLKPPFLNFFFFFWGSPEFLGAGRCEGVKLAEPEPAAPRWVQPRARHCADGRMEPVPKNFNSKHDLNQINGDIHEGKGLTPLAPQSAATNPINSPSLGGETPHPLTPQIGTGRIYFVIYFK